MTSTDPLAQFIEELGLSVEEDGMPRIAGRILGLLLVHEGPFRFDELADQLQVSRGSVSINTRLLEQMGLIERFTVPGDRRDLFRACEDLHGRLLEKSLRRLAQRQTMVDRCLERLDANHSHARRRLESMKRFYGHAIQSTQAFLEDWRGGTVGDANGSAPNDEAPLRTASGGGGR